MSHNPLHEREQRRIAILAAAVTGMALPLTGLAVHASSAADHQEGWPMVHTAVGLVFVLAVGWHCLANRRALVRYMRGSGPLADSHGVTTRQGGRFFAGLRRSDENATAHVLLDKSRCQACWLCVERCSRSVFGKVDILGHRHAKIGAADGCMGCGRCVAVCPADAISHRVVTSEPVLGEGSRS